MTKPILFLLHFAGGNCYSFQFMMPFLENFEVIVPELPGRGKRMKEDLLTGFDQAARDIFDQVAKKVGSSPFIIYGHSMGAYLALKVSGMMEKRGRPPRHLFVSGNPGPGIMGVRNRHLLGREAFKEELDKLGGFSAEMMADSDLFNLFEPILRADFKIVETHDLSDITAINVPLYAIMGDLEEKKDKISNWASFTRSFFQYEILKGNHFFIYDHPQRMADLFKGVMKTIP